MSALTLIISISLAAQVQPAPANSCRNGSFEELAVSGFPADWGPLGRAEVSPDAHSGNRSLRLVRTNEPSAQETGVNGRNIDRLKGGMSFHYKGVSAKDAKLHFYAVPLAADGVERTGAPRARFAVPQDQVGDGRWHLGRVKYDFSQNAAVKSVVFAARVEGSAGELLVDDVSYVEQVGPVMRFGSVRLEEDPKSPGQRCTVSTLIENSGDVPASGVRVVIEVPRGLDTIPMEIPIGDLKPDVRRPISWTLEGKRTQPGRLRLSATSGAEVATTSLEIAPKWEIKSFGPTSPLATAGEVAVLECVLTNTGTASVLDPHAEFTLGGKKVEVRGEQCPPGSSLVLHSSFRPEAQAMRIPATVRVRCQGVQEPITLNSSLVVGEPSQLPSPSGKLRAALVGGSRSPSLLPSAGCAVLESEHLRLAFRRNSFGYGPGEIAVKAASGWTTVACLPRLGRIVYLDDSATRQERIVAVSDDPACTQENDHSAQVQFVWNDTVIGKSPLHLLVTFALNAGAKTIATRYELASEKPCRLLALEGPMLYALERDEAVYPGLEWLVEDEVSSGALDIAQGHADRIRYVVHPNFVTAPAIGVHGSHGTVGLCWDIHQQWDGQRDRPSAVFASPDRFENQRAHLMGLFLPTVPEFVQVNSREAASGKPFLLEPGKSIRLEAQIYADADARDALAVIDQWIKLYGFPTPAPLPRGSYEREIEFSMQAYLKSLWIPETKEWWTSKGGGPMSAKERSSTFVAELLTGAMLSPNADVRRLCRERAEQVLPLVGGELRLDAQRFPGHLDQILAGAGGGAAELLAARGKDGAWRFDANQMGTGPFVGMDYHELGPDRAGEVGLCAARATQVLRYARTAGDVEAYRQMLSTLEIMESFRVPRAAQVWEVPVHTPDILAAAEATEAFLEAYRFSRDPRWLRDAVMWARRGLPFVYLWNDPERPFLLGATIPVFGATWMQGSWFGRPVQWNGLRYAEAILKLAAYDTSYPWRQIAATIVHSALYQQDTRGENVALWPDNISAVDSEKCPWVFTPKMILGDVLRLMGRGEDVATVAVGPGERRMHINANAKLSQAACVSDTCQFHVTYPTGEQGIVVVFNVTRPTKVFLSGKPIAEREDIEKGMQPGWRYLPGAACLSIRVPRDGESAIRIDGAGFLPGLRLPQLAESIDFTFNESSEGWRAAHDVEELRVEKGSLVGRVTGPDPYLIRHLLRVRGDDCPIVVVRMRATSGQVGKFYWTTGSSPEFAEDKVIVFPIQTDGLFHDYRLEAGSHPRWAGLIVTAVRLDPAKGVKAADFAVDYIRGESVARR
jgi:hypothetical protein